MKLNGKWTKGLSLLLAMAVLTVMATSCKPGVEPAESDASPTSAPTTQADAPESSEPLPDDTSESSSEPDETSVDESSDWPDYSDWEEPEATTPSTTGTTQTKPTAPGLGTISYPDPPNSNFTYQELPNTQAGDMKFLVPVQEKFPTGAAKKVDLSSNPNRIYNALDFGVTANDLTDDSVALNEALKQIATVRGTLYIPAGLYIINQPLTVPQEVRVVGDFTTPEDQKNATVFLAYYGHGNDQLLPLITMGGSSAMKGIQIYYPRQSKTNPVKYPPTFKIKKGGIRVTLEDMFVVNPWYLGDFVAESGQHNFYNIWAQPLYKGFQMDNCLDIGRLRHVNFGAYWSQYATAFTRKNLTALIFQKADWEYVDDVTISDAAVALKMTTSATGSKGNVELSNVNVYNSVVAVQIDDCQEHAGTVFYDCSLMGQILVNYLNNGPVKFVNCRLQANDGKETPIDLNGAGTVILRSCTIDTSLAPDEFTAAIHLNVDEAILTDNTITGVNATHVFIDTETKAAILTGNTAKNGSFVIEKDENSKGNYLY